MEAMNLRRRETVKLKAWILRTKRAQKIFVPLDSEIRMQSALHQDTRPTERNRFVNLRANLIDRAHVGVRGAWPAIERTERTEDVADIRIVNVSIDDVGDDVIGMARLAKLISRAADASNIVGLDHPGAIVAFQPVPGNRFSDNR